MYVVTCKQKNIVIRLPTLAITHARHSNEKAPQKCKSDESCNERDVYSRCKSGRAYTSTRSITRCVAGSIANETQSSRNDDTAIGLLLVKQGVVPDGRDVRAREPPHGRYPS